MQTYEQTTNNLKTCREHWLVTGAAGFIGSNLVEALLLLDQKVVGLDNFATGYRQNLEQIRNSVSTKQWDNFTLIEGDIRDLNTCMQVTTGIDFILHQAALGSVPHSIEDPLAANASNVTGFLNMLVAARDARVKRFIYAASSATYGDQPELPKKEESIGRQLSPYAVTKYINELYADVFAQNYGTEAIGLRYFNVFGKRQDPKGAYAAVIPQWFSSMLNKEAIFIYGTGETSRDFCHIDNVVQANILAACTKNPAAVNQIYNVACGERITLSRLFEMIKTMVVKYNRDAENCSPIYSDFRQGDVLHSLADIGKIKRLLGYKTIHAVDAGLEKAAQWYAENLLCN